jgi:hypothetical protein
LRKKCKVLTIESDEVERASIPIGTTEVENVEYISLGCPKCNTTFLVPVTAIRMLLISKRKQAGLV